MRTYPILLVATLALAACEREPEAAEARAELCEDLAELRAAVLFLRNPPATATIDDMKGALEEVRDELGDVREAAGELSASRRQEISDRFDQLVADVRTVPQDATPAQVAEQARVRLQSFQASIDQARAEAGCPAT